MAQPKTDTITVKEGDGRMVRDPATGKRIPAEGIAVLWADPFWHRRLAAGDVVVIDGDKPAADAPADTNSTNRTRTR